MAKQTPKVRQLSASQRAVAESICAGLGERLTPARMEAYTELMLCEKPLSAYDLIARLEERQQRKIAPLTVYRHLDFLMRVGLVHRLESKQAYLACDHPEHAHKSQYLLCSACGKADEVESEQLMRVLSKIMDQQGFEAEHSVVEVTGVCSDCRH